MATVRPLRATLANRGFLVHYMQMIAAMVVGMIVLGPLSMVAADVPVEVDTLMMATWMTIGMAALMAWHRHSWRAISEMGAVMYLSFAVLFPGYWLGALSEDGLMLIGHALMLPAMALAMLYRREEYVRD